MGWSIDASNASEKAHKQYIDYALKFKEWVKQKKKKLELYSNLNQIYVEEYINDLKSQELSHDTIRLRILPIRMSANYMESLGYSNPLRRLKLRRTEPIQIKYMNDKDLFDFIKWLKENCSDIYPICLLQGFAGLRMLEAAYLREQDIDIELRTIKIDKTSLHTPKTLYSYRTLPIGETILNTIMSYMKNRKIIHTEGYLFLNNLGNTWTTDALGSKIKKALNKFGKESGNKEIQKLSAKSFRKAFSTILDTNIKCNEKAINMYLGHSGGSIRDTHYTGKDITFLRTEIADKIEEQFTLDHGQNHGQHKLAGII